MQQQFGHNHQNDGNHYTDLPSNLLSYGHSQSNGGDLNGSFGHFLSNRYISIQFESANAGAHPGGPIGPSQQFAPTDITPTSLSFYGASGITTPVYQDLHPGAQQANSFDDGMRHDNPGHDVGSGRFSSTSLRPLAPATPSSSRAVRSSSRRHANGMANQGSHLPGPHFPPSVPSDSMQPGQHHASPIVGRDVNQRRRRTGPRSPSLSTHSPVQSTSVRYDPYGTIESPVEAAHGQASLPSLSLPELAALQTRSQSASYKLSSSEFSSRLEVFEEQVWYKKETRMEEPPVTAGDVFVRRNYIKKSDKTRFYTFVTINSSNGKARCLVPNGIINSQGEMHECEIEWEKRKDAVAHVCLFLDYKPYKCKCTKPGHLCENTYPTRERRNDHHSKVKKGPDSRVECEFCEKEVSERNLPRHRSKCKARCNQSPQ